MGIRTDLLVTEEIVDSSALRASPFEFERAKRVEAALSILEGKWKIVILNRLFARRPRHLSTHAVATASNFGEVRVGQANSSSAVSTESRIRTHRVWKNALPGDDDAC
jgi:hypothetical protein